MITQQVCCIVGLLQAIVINVQTQLPSSGVLANLGDRIKIMLLVLSIVSAAGWDSNLAAHAQDSAEELADGSDGADPFETFDHWVEDYLIAGASAADVQLLREGEALALLRRGALAGLIESDPERALGLVIPAGTRQRLPESVVRHLEERVSAVGRFDVIAFLPRVGAPAVPGVERFVTTGNRTFKAFVYGRRLTQTSKENIPVHGIAIDRSFAVDESPIRVLEPAELPVPVLPLSIQDERCPDRNGVAPTAVWIHLGDRILRVCDPADVESVRQLLESREAGIGPENYSSANGSWTQGEKTILLVRVNFPDQLGESISETDAYTLMRTVNAFLVENSYGATSLRTTVTPLLTMPHDQSWYVSTSDIFLGLRALLEDARALASAAGYPDSDFDLDCVHNSLGSHFLDCAYVGARGMWLSGQRARTACHEIGHNLGLWHANAWKTTDGSVIGPGGNIEYGNPFDTMGAADRGHFNVFYKYALNWLPASAVQTFTSDGVFQLQSFDNPGLSNGFTYALRIPKDDRDYWIETRRSLNPGNVILNWSPWALSGGGTQLLDITPSSEGAFYDAPLESGRSFYDPDLGLRIVPLPPRPASPESTDVLVQHVHYRTVEAESGVEGIPGAAIDDPLASHGQFVLLPAVDENAQCLAIDVLAEGEYALWCRLRAPNAGPISLSVAVDDDPGYSKTIWSAAGDGWRWSPLCDPASIVLMQPTPKRFRLMRGPHILHLAAQFRDTQLDSVLVTDDPTPDIPPLISAIPDHLSILGEVSVPITFTLVGFESQSAVVSLTASSSNPKLVRSTDLVIGGEGVNRTLTVSPRSNQLGTAQITLNSVKVNGTASSAAFSLTVIGKVQALVNAAASGDTIEVPPETYLDRIVLQRM